jgi:hypothetical protein
MGSVTPDNIVVRLGPEYGSSVPSECFLSVSELSAFFLLVICIVDLSLNTTRSVEDQVVAEEDSEEEDDADEAEEENNVSPGLLPIG